MVKTFYTALICICSLVSAQAQSDYNLELLSNPTDPCTAGFNDVWGFRHSNGTEYAVLGTRCGTSIYDLSNPAEPILVEEMPGAPGIWRDMKNWGDYIYVVADQGGFGIQVIDLTDTGNVRSWTYNPLDNLGATLWTAHNLFIDALGFLYICGSQFNSGGVVIFDLNLNDSIPPIVGYGPPFYAHDIYVNEARNLMVTSDIYLGVFTLCELDRSTSPVSVNVLASQETGTHFTHNAWTTDDGNTVFTTDERSNARVECYDISNPDEIVFLSEYAPYKNLSKSILPHNVHVKGNHLIISYYSEGIKIVDISKPANPVEIASYDTHPATSGSNGDWGAFPFFTSDLVLASDMSNGLFVLQPDYSTKVGYLEGKVMNVESVAIDSAIIKIFAIDSSYQYSRNGGQYAVGLVDQTTLAAESQTAFPGNIVQVQISRNGYQTKDTIIEFIPDSTLNHNFILQAVALPVELISFSASTINCQNEIQWTVGSEINHSHFELQSSENGRDFHLIGEIYPHQAVANNYSFTDVDNRPLNFYRLKQVDVDGSFEYSKIISQSNHCEKHAELSIFPNPASQYLTINGLAEIATVRIYDASGKMVMIRNMPVPTLDIQNFNPGVYYLKINTGEHTEVHRFIKSN